MDTNPLYLADLYRSGNYARFMRDGYATARQYNMSPVALWRQMASQNPAADFRQFAERLSSAGHDEWDVLRQPGFGFIGLDSAATGLLTPAARAELAELAKRRAEQFQLPPGMGLGDFVRSDSLTFAGRLDSFLQDVARGVPGFGRQSPYFDNNVLRAAFALSSTQTANPYESKQILHMALAGIVPAEIFQRPTVTDEHTRIQYEILGKSLPTIREILHDSRLVERGIVDPARITFLLRTFGNATGEHVRALTQFVNAEAWLRGVEKRTSSLRLDSKTPVIHLKTRPTPAEVGVEIPADKKYGLSPGVHAVASKTGTLVLFNQVTSRYAFLDPTQSDVLRALALTGNFDHTVQIFQARYPEQAEATLREDIARCVQEFSKHELFTTDDSFEPRRLPLKRGEISLEATESRVARASTLDDEEKPRLGERAAALVGLIGSLVINRFRPQASRPLLARLQESKRMKPATLAEATRLSLAVQTIPLAGRVACLETSYSIALAAALRNRVVQLHRGVSFEPMSHHAWVEADGQVVTTPLDGRVSGSFESFYKA